MPDLEPAPILRQNHLEFGGGFALAELPVHKDGLGNATPLRFKVGPGFHFDLSWQVLKYLRFTGYMSEHYHGMDFPKGSLVPQALANASNQVYSFGVRISPTLPLGKRVRLWATGGVGWGRIEYGRLTTEGPAPYQIYERSESFFEIPLGLGGSVELIPRWLSLRVELTGSFVPSQIGDALAAGGQAISSGSMIMVKPMPQLDAYFLQTIGLSLHL